MFAFQLRTLILIARLFPTSIIAAAATVILRLGCAVLLRSLDILLRCCGLLRTGLVVWIPGLPILTGTVIVFPGTLLLRPVILPVIALALGFFLGLVRHIVGENALVKHGDGFRLRLLFRGLGQRGNVVGNGRIVLLALAVPENADIAVVIAFHGGGVIVQPNLDGLLEQAHIGDSALAIAGVDNGILLGAGFNQGFIGVLLIFQAAHQSAAGAGDLRGVQG